MKVRIIEKAFSPFEICINFETREEAEEFYTVFNTTSISESLDYLSATKIRGALDGFYNIDGPTELTSKIKKHPSIGVKL